jgi:ABC-2 type transport system permease protein
VTSNSVYQMVNECGWRMGFANLLCKENGTWWRTWRWLIQSLLWLVLLNGLVAIVLWATPIPKNNAREVVGGSGPIEAEKQASLETVQSIMRDKPTAGMLIFLLFNGIAVPIAAVIVGQDAIIGEKQSGTAAWVLSKPVSRPAFILSKLAGHALGFGITSVMIQGAIAYAQISFAAGEFRPLPGFVGALGLLFLNLLFYLTLTLMLGTFFDGRGGVLGISLALLLGYQLFLGLAPWLATVMPWALVLNVTPDGVPLSFSLAMGRPLSTVTPIIATAAWCLIFTAVALWRFEREEF